MQRKDDAGRGKTKSHSETVSKKVKSTESAKKRASIVVSSANESSRHPRHSSGHDESSRRRDSAAADSAEAIVDRVARQSLKDRYIRMLKGVGSGTGTAADSAKKETLEKEFSESMSKLLKKQEIFY